MTMRPLRWLAHIRACSADDTKNGTPKLITIETEVQANTLTEALAVSAQWGIDYGYHVYGVQVAPVGAKLETCAYHPISHIELVKGPRPQPQHHPLLLPAPEVEELPNGAGDDGEDYATPPTTQARPQLNWFTNLDYFGEAISPPKYGEEVAYDTCATKQ